MEEGTTVTGSLTVGVDTSHGLTGDYWRLDDVEPGRSYRVELTLTDTVDGTTSKGGSIGTGFSQPGTAAVTSFGRDDFRDDGYAFVHFTALRAQGGQSRTGHEYFAKVNAWDLRRADDDPLTYDGDYEITLTDVTGVELVLENTHSATGRPAFGDQPSTLTIITPEKSDRLNIEVSDSNVGRRYGVGFTTGPTTGTEKWVIDRIAFLISAAGPSEKGPYVEVYDSLPDAAATLVCSTEDSSGRNFAGEHGFTANTVYAVTQLAPDCADSELDPSTTYYMVFHTRLNLSPHHLSLTPDDGQAGYGSGWTVADTASVQVGTGDWTTVSRTVGTGMDATTFTDVPRFRIWARKVEAGAMGEQQAPNSPPAGVPGITGTFRTGEVLTATTDGITDPDGMTAAVFTYQWLHYDTTTETETIIDNATDQTYTVTDEDSGIGIRVRVTFTDDGGAEETVTSDTYLAAPPVVIPDDDEGVPDEDDGVPDSDEGVPDSDEGTPRDSEEQVGGAQGAAEQEVALTATTHKVPASHDGANAFTFELHFSETPADGFSYTTVRDHAFTVTGGEVTHARRVERGKNVKWKITVKPSGDGAVTLTAPATTDCTATGAICNDDGAKFSGLEKFTVSGPASSVPSAPTGLTATVNADGSITLTWDDPGDDTITGYQVLRRRPAEGEATLEVYVAATGNHETTTYTDTAVTAGTRHVYRIKAINSEGVGPQSSYVNVDP